MRTDKEVGVQRQSTGEPAKSRAIAPRGARDGARNRGGKKQVRIPKGMRTDKEVGVQRQSTGEPAKSRAIAPRGARDGARNRGGKEQVRIPKGMRTDKEQSVGRQKMGKERSRPPSPFEGRSTECPFFAASYHKAMGQLTHDVLGFKGACSLARPAFRRPGRSAVEKGQGVVPKTSRPLTCSGVRGFSTEPSPAICSRDCGGGKNCSTVALGHLVRVHKWTRTNKQQSVRRRKMGQKAKSPALAPKGRSTKWPFRAANHLVDEDNDERGLKQIGIVDKMEARG